MAFPWNVLAKADLAHAHLVEDMKLGLDLASQGTPPIFCDEAIILSPLPHSIEGATTQRSRWVRGHLSLMGLALSRLPKHLAPGQVVCRRVGHKRSCSPLNDPHYHARCRSLECFDPDRALGAAFDAPWNGLWNDGGFFDRDTGGLVGVWPGCHPCTKPLQTCGACFCAHCQVSSGCVQTKKGWLGPHGKETLTAPRTRVMSLNSGTDTFDVLSGLDDERSIEDRRLENYGYKAIRTKNMAHPRGFEPLASAFGGQRSIQTPSQARYKKLNEFSCFQQSMIFCIASQRG